MELFLTRNKSSRNSTIGQLEDEDQFLAYTLEDVVRPEKVYGKTAIPAGRYEVVVTYSNRFKQLMPLLLNVKGFEGIRIHAGNTAADTEGCILVGNTKAVDFVGESRKAYSVIFKKIQDACKKEKVFITIK